MHSSIEKQFTRAAAAYTEKAALHQTIAQSLLDRIEDAAPRRILEIGCGTGFLTERLVERFPSAHLDAVDLSHSMIAQARARVNSSNGLAFHPGDVRLFYSNEPYELIVSSSSLQWIRPFSRLFSHLSSQLAPKGVLAFSLMLDGTFGELHALRREMFPSKIPRASLPTASEVQEALHAAGFTLLSECTEARTESHESAAAFLRSIHERGFSGGDVSRGNVLLTRGEIRKLEQAYDRRFSASGVVQATFQVGYFSAE